QGCGVCVQAGDRARCLGRRGAPRADGAQHPGDQGHRRFAHLSRRPLSQGRRWRVDLRHRFRAARGRRATPAGRGFDLHRGRMDEWAGFYERLFNFREVRYFDIEGKLTGLKSKAMTSPCGKIRIPINDSADDKSQIQEYLLAYHGEGIQHVALGTSDIYATVETLRARNVEFQGTPDTYYDLLATRLPNHKEDTARLKKNRILLDGAPAKNEMLLQIFTTTVVGPIFFEIIQRKGNEGFGEGNFQALFESIELDQIRRGVLKT